MLDETRVKELVDIYETLYDVESEVKDIVSGARTRIKEEKTGMKDWSERNQLDPKTVAKVYKDYKEWREGNLKWGEADDYTDLQVTIMDEVTVEDKEKE